MISPIRQPRATPYLLLHFFRFSPLILLRSTFCQVLFSHSPLSSLLTPHFYQLPSLLFSSTPSGAGGSSLFFFLTFLPLTLSPLSSLLSPRSSLLASTHLLLISGLRFIYIGKLLGVSWVLVDRPEGWGPTKAQPTPNQGPTRPQSVVDVFRR